jgi:hypothetical protein
MQGVMIVNTHVLGVAIKLVISKSKKRGKSI